MNIDNFKVERYAEGWVVKVPYEGKDKQGNPKTQYRNSYFPTLEQSLRHIRDRLAGECQNTRELISLLEKARDIDEQIVGRIALVRGEAA